MNADDLLDTPLAELARRLRDGGARAGDLARVALDRAAASGLGGYRVLSAERAEREASIVDLAFGVGRDLGPLAGIPVSVKDLYGVPGERTFAGSARPLPERFERPGPFLGAALRQMCVVIGKTHTVEFAFGGIGTNAHWGTPRNPYDPRSHRAPGGSSSGAGTSLFEGSAKIAFGTDTAGSVRIPAAWTGHVGLKTTKGRWSTEGIVPLSTTLDTPGILTRTVEDAIFAFSALDAPPASFAEALDAIPRRSTRGLRLAFTDGLFREDTSPGILEAVSDALARLERAGAWVRDLALPGADEARGVFDLGGPTAIELQRFLSAVLPDWLAELDPSVRDRLMTAASTPAAEYLNRLERMRSAHRSAMASFEDVDAYVTPTVALTPPKLQEIAELSDYRRANVLALRNPGVVSFLGLCAVSLPCGKDAEGMPVGLQLIGPAGGELALLGVARAVEGAIGSSKDRV